MTILKAIIIGWRAHSALSALYTFNLYHNEMGQGQAETCGCFRKANLLPPGNNILQMCVQHWARWGSESQKRNRHRNDPPSGDRGSILKINVLYFLSKQLRGSQFYMERPLARWGGKLLSAHHAPCQSKWLTMYNNLSFWPCIIIIFLQEVSRGAAVFTSLHVVGGLCPLADWCPGYPSPVAWLQTLTDKGTIVFG